MLLLKDGIIVDPKTETQKRGDILISQDQIIKIGSDLSEDGLDKLTVIDCSNLVIMPGFIDVHSHFRDPGLTYKEDILTGARAAKRGGYTTVVLMANTKPVVDNTDTLEYVLHRGEETDIRVKSCATVTEGMKGLKTVDFSKLINAGAVGFTDDGIPLTDAAIVREAMRITSSLNVPISFHEEDPSLIQNNGINRGKASEYYKIGGSPREAEIALVERDLSIALETNAIMDVQHISTKESVQLVREAKAKGGRIHAEACPHHFTLTEEAVIQYGTLAKMNPPLRTEEDRQAIIQGLLDGTLDLIATDHAPHSSDEKKKPITEAPSGIIGLETAFSLAYMELVEKHGMSLSSLAGCLSYHPAQMYGFNKLGYIEEGVLADLTIIDCNAEWKFTHSCSKSENSPFLGRVLKGQVVYTICNGKIVFEGRSN